MAELSKTARRSMQTEVGSALSRTPVAWVFRSQPGKMQMRPYLTCYKDGEAEAFVAANEGYFVAKWDAARKR